MSKKFRLFSGFAAIALGLMMFMGIKGRHHRAYAHGNFSRGAERFESHRGSAATAAGESGDSDNDSQARSDYSGAHFKSRHGFHRGPGLIGGLLRLILLGLIIKMVLKAINRRRGKHGHMHAESADDLENDIRVGDEINRNEAATNTMSIDDMTVDDLLLAMKRLGIKKLEL